MAAHSPPKSPVTGTVVVPVLNEAATLGSFLTALLARLDQHWQVMVVDGGSSDGTIDIAGQFPVQLVHSAPGRARQMNAGVAAGIDSDLILFLHSDTRLPSAVLPELNAFFYSSQQWGFFRVKLDSSLRLLALVSTMMNWRSRFSGIGTGDQGLLVRTQFWLTNGGFADLPLMEDVEFCRRVKKQAPPFCSPLKVLVSARKWERQGPIKTILLMWLIRLAYVLGVAPKRLHRWYYGRPCQ